MTTIPHRELRNNSSSILDRVKNGEIIDVTKNGETAATLIPPNSSPLERLIAAGRVRRREHGSAVDLTALNRVDAVISTDEILADLRGDR